MIVTDRDALQAVRLGLTLAVTLRELYANDWQPEKLMTLLVNRQAFDGVRAGQTGAVIAEEWAVDIVAFGDRTAAYRIYD